MHDLRTPGLPRIAWRWLLAIALARLALHLLTNGQYGFHRDELAFLEDARHLAWGYVAYPPLTPALAHASMTLFGDGLSAYRAPSALLQALATLVAGLIARELGGGRAAQVVAAIAVACVPFSLLAGSMFQYTSPDYCWWVLAAWLLLKLANGGDRRWWLALGAVIGLGMLTRYTMLFCAAGIVVAMLATPLRRHLASPWPWLGAVVSLLLFAPNAWWQWQHHFVYLDFVQAIHARDVRIGRADGFLGGQLLVGAGPLLAPLWIAGLAWLCLARSARPGRVLAWLYGTALLLFWLADARAYYLAPAYPMLLAAGSVALARGIARLRPRAALAADIATGTWLALAFATAAVVSLPVSPVGSKGWSIARRFHDNFAEQIGWPELAAQVAAVYRALPPGEQAHTAISASNYGEAGAIDRYGPALGLPSAIATVNSYWARGPGDPLPRTVIVLGRDADAVTGLPATCVPAGQFQVPHGVENEEAGHPDIFVCRDFRVPVQRLWPPAPDFG